jgi:flagellar hook-associated protein 3 FlgL
MSTRITQSMVSSRVLSDLQDVSYRLSQTQEKLSSGRELTKPSDDPFATSKALSLSNDLEGNQQFQRTVNDATSWANLTETTLSSVNSAAQRARALLVQAGNDTNGTTSRSAVADEIDQLIDEVKGDANVQYGGQYVLSGADTTTAPYVVGGSPPDDAYKGDTGGVFRQIGPGVSVQINTDGSSVLGSGVPGDGGLISVLRGISQHLRGGTAADADTLRTTDLSSLDASMDKVTSARAVNGATTNRLSSASDRLSQIEQSTTSLLSDTQDADMAKTMIDFSMQQTVYQSALRSGANIVQASLLDFLST